jgi:exopolysaccharide production protein ExoZ
MQRIKPFKTLDGFRGFAAIWVVMAHSVGPWIGSGNEAHLRNPLYAFSIRGQLGVSIFFVISGYSITAAAYASLVSGKTIGRYCFERVRRIYPPYFFALVITTLSAAAIIFAASHHLIAGIHHVPDLPRSAVFWIANVFLLQFELRTDSLNQVFWSLCYEVSFYFIIGLFLLGAKWITRKHGLHAGTVFLVSAMGASTIGTLVWLLKGVPVFPLDLWHQFSIGGLLFFLLESRPGTVAGYTPRFLGFIVATTSVVAFLTAAFIIVGPVGFQSIDHPSLKTRTAVCLGFSLSLIVLRRFDERIVSLRSVKPLLWIGAFSYSLYLTHTAVLPYVDILCRRLGMNGSHYWIAVIIQIVAALLFGQLSFLAVEKHFISKRQVSRIAEEIPPHLVH